MKSGDDAGRLTVGRFAPWSERAAALWTLVAGVTALRVLYLAFLCPYTLIEDEAHYWEWARRPEWSYYSKGPGVAWAIALGRSIAGDGELGVRLPAAIFSGLGAVAVGLLARRYAGGRAGFFAAACWLLAPMLQVAGLVMTIDGPYCACWAWACYLAWRAIREGRSSSWAWLGLVVGLGVLFKYTMLIFLPSVAVGLVASRASGRQWLGLGLGALLTLACGAPIAVWNQAHGWPTVAHLLGHLGLAGGDTPVTQGEHGWRYNPLWTLSYLGTQVGVVGPVMVLALGELWRSRRAGAWRADGTALLLGLSLPMYAFYLLVSLDTSPEGNWALAGAISLLPIAARGVVLGMDAWEARLATWRALPKPRPRAGFFVRRPESFVQVCWYAAVVVGLVSGVGMLRLDLVRRLPGLGAIPLHRFMGADIMAAHVARLEDSLAGGTGLRPWVVALHYGRASQMAFYLPGRPTVYCSSSRMLGGRRTQYDYWPATDLDDPELLGRPAVLLGGTREAWARVFERVEEVGTLEGDGKKGRPAFLGYDYLGFEDADRGGGPQ